MKQSALFMLPVILATSCTKQEFQKDPSLISAKKAEGKKDDWYESNRVDQDAYNVIYFVPTDLPLPSDSRLADIDTAMFFAQNWYEKQMIRNGYGNKTFALSVSRNTKHIQLIVIQGANPASYYTSNGLVKEEIENYFATNPALKHSDFSIVLSDNASGFANNTNGKMAFARSSDNYHMTHTGIYLDGLELLHSGTFGGVLHEMGHSFGSPHLAHTASDLPYKSIMGAGGANLYNAGGNEDKVFVIPASAAIFNNSQAFNLKTNGIDYYATTPTIVLTSYDIVKNTTTQSTDADVVFTSDVKPAYVYISYDAAPFNVNNDYDKVPFGTADIIPTGKPNEYRFHLQMPWADFFDSYQDADKVNNNIQFAISVISENGFRTQALAYQYTITSAPEPNYDIESSLLAFSDRSNGALRPIPPQRKVEAISHQTCLMAI